MSNDRPEGAPRRGLMFVLSSPSGAGKTSLSKGLLAGDGSLILSISATTRPPRRGEVPGEDYIFLDEAEFRRMVEAGAFFEWAQVFDHFYGTPKAPVEAALAEGRDVLFDVDWQGGRALAAAAPQDVVKVFILPPSIEALRERLTQRGQDDPAVIERRMARAAGEIEHWDEYDYVLINADFHETLDSLFTLLAAERLKQGRHPWLADFVAGLR